MPDQTALLLWRAYVPRWAYAPLSGEGAARFGGRWNRAGQSCLYAAREISTAFAEYNQGFAQHPATLVQLVLRGARLADLTNETTLRRFGLTPEIHDCAWRDALDRGLVPETHEAASAIQAAGFDGLIYPSFMSPGGTNVALWRWNAEGAPQLTVIDPDNRLPRSPASWL